MEALLVAMILVLLARTSHRLARFSRASEPAGGGEAPRRPRPLPKARRTASERASEAATHRRRLDWLAGERNAADGDPAALRRLENLRAAEEARHAEKLRRLASEDPYA